MGQAGQTGTPGLDDAEGAMKQAEQALKSDGKGKEAVDAQGKALDGLRKGARELAKKMQQQQGGEPGEGGEGEDGKKGRGTGENGEGPFGRANHQHPVDATAAQRARKVLEELRRRLADPSRDQEELDYLERLIKPY
jgi:hypothetical protein